MLKVVIAFLITLNIAQSNAMDLFNEHTNQLDQNLMFAIERGDEEACRHYHAQGACIFSMRISPLHFATSKGYLKVCKLLLEQADDQSDSVETQDEFGDTPFIIACKKGYFDIAQLLIKNGANIHTRNRKGRDASFYAYKHEHYTIQALLAKTKNPVCQKSTLVAFLGIKKFKKSPLVTLIDVNVMRGIAKTAKILSDENKLLFDLALCCIARSMPQEGARFHEPNFQDYDEYDGAIATANLIPHSSIASQENTDSKFSCNCPMQ
jgi:ankyrin repeat protein